MKFLVSYDIPASPAGDRRRAKLARFLEGLGLRVQYSLFELEIPPAKIANVVESMEQLLDQESDSVRIYGLCAACREKELSLGAYAVCEHGPLLIW